MKALSLTQPWAHAVVHLGKRIENRNWRGCSYRGPILIHAAKSVGARMAFDEAVEKILDVVKPTAGTERLALLQPFAEMHVIARGIHHAEGFWMPAPTLERGGIIGRARIDGVIRSDADFAAYAANTPGGEAQRAWWFGGFALVLADVEPLPFVRCNGALGLFEVPESVIGAVA